MSRLDCHAFARRGAALALAAVLSLALSRSAAGQGKAVPIFTNGQAQVVPGFQDKSQWIREQLWVETEFDSDHDGKRDRVHVDVTRPRQTETEGLKVPIIYESSPYYAGIPETKNWDVHQELNSASPPRVSSTASSLNASSGMPSQSGHLLIANSYVNSWVPRGFAVVHSESPGTGLSQGCPTVGGDNEALAPKAVIDWLNGRARGFKTVDGNDTVVASWSTGKVGMIGTSYNGTLTLAAATTGVDGLKVAIPVSPVSSWYDYYRSNGLVRSPGGYLGEDMDVLFDLINTGHGKVSCAAMVRDSVLVPRENRVNGDYSDFWAGRDYLAKVNNIKAPVLMVHGFGDWNVMPDQSARIYEALKQRHMPAMAFFHQGGHGGDPPASQLNRLFTHYLYGVDNGVEKDPPVSILQEDAGPLAGYSSLPEGTPYADYPDPASAAVTLYPQGGGRKTGALKIEKGTGQDKQRLIDDVSLTPGALVGADSSDHRLLYATTVLSEPVRLSGWSKITTLLASSKPDANLSIYLVSLPAIGDTEGRARLITRGWADPQNYKSLTQSEPLVPGKFYPISFDLQPQDKVIPAGVRIALMIFSSDQGYTLWPQPGTEVNIDVGSTSVVLPVVGGAAALERALKPKGH